MNSKETFSGLLVAEGASIRGAVLLGQGVSIWYHAKLNGTDGEISVGEHTNIQDHVQIIGPVKIGQACTIGHGATLRGCSVGDHTLIGIGAVVPENVRIGNHCIIGAAACLAPGTEIPDGMMALGNPAKVVRPLTQADIEENQEYIHKYDRNIQRYLLGK